MSYCRVARGGSDLYLFESIAGHIECCGCAFNDPWIVVLNSVDEAIAHVEKHRRAGDLVPEGLEDDIRHRNPWNGDA